MLGYRTFVNVAGDRAAILGLVEEQVKAWLREKRWDADALEPGTTASLAEGVQGTFLKLASQDESSTIRFQTREESGFVLRLTAHVPGAEDQSPWLWVDVDSPGATQRPGAPRIWDKLLRVLDVRDGGQSLPPAPVTLGAAEVGALINRVLDPRRRTIAFVAGSGDGIELSAWAGHVADMTRRCRGLASTAVLDPEASSIFAQRMGSELAVRPWNLRTFMPQVDSDDPADPLRHRFLSMQRITDEPVGRIASMLEARAAAVIRELPLPPDAVRVDRVISKRLDDAVIDRITIVESDVTSAILPATAEPTSARTKVDVPERTDIRISAQAHDALAGAVRELLGGGTVDDVAVGRLLSLAAVGRQATAQQVAVRARVDQLQAQVEDLSDQLQATKSELDDESLGHAETELDRLRAEDLVRRLRVRLAESGTDAWSELPAADGDLTPADFSELLAWFNRLHRVEFTGQADLTIGLDAYDPAQTWVAKTWDALCALEDYATATADGRCSTHVDGYLRDLPTGCRGVSVNRHARDESQDVHSNPRFRRERELFVPTEVDPSGIVFMGAHFKLAQWRLISPRMHYYDDSTRTGKIYVGYLGPHLSTKQTN